MESRVLLVAFLILPGPSSIYSDNLGYLDSTLRDMYREACDDELVTLACPNGTVIYIQKAEYGKPGSLTEQTCLDDRPGPLASDDCLLPNAMQYALLGTVVGVCQRKPDCQVSTKVSLVSDGRNDRVADPCPHARKSVRVTYKCRPYEFKSLVICEGNMLRLSCDTDFRIVVYDAMYGRTAFEPDCLQKGPEENCKAPTAARTVIHMCHGKRRCEVPANNSLFGAPCKVNTRVYLKVVHACVPLDVLAETLLDGDEGTPGGTTAGRISDNSAPPKAASTQMPSSRNVQINTGDSAESTRLKIFMYIGISVLCFVILCILLIGVRCYIIRKNANKSKNGDMFIAEAPNVFNDAVSDIDNDIDVTHISGTFYDPVHPDMILYRDVPDSRGTLRAMRPLSTIYPCAGASMYGNIDYVPPQYREVAAGRLSREASKEKEDVDNHDVASPKSLGRFSNSQYYYG